MNEKDAEKKFPQHTAPKAAAPATEERKRKIPSDLPPGVADETRNIDAIFDRVIVQLFNTFPVPSPFRRATEEEIRALEEKIVLELHYGVASSVELPKPFPDPATPPPANPPC
jgi:hypothetical protein